MLGGGDHSEMTRIALGGLSLGGGSSMLSTTITGTSAGSTTSTDGKLISNASSLSIRRLQQKTPVNSSMVGTVTGSTASPLVSTSKSRPGQHKTSTVTASTNAALATSFNNASPKRPRSRKEEVSPRPLNTPNNTTVTATTTIGKQHGNAVSIPVETTADHIRVTLNKTMEDEEDEELDVGGEDEEDDLR
ncbi:hypothetical protein BDF19DRAFT_412253 [Syncephalis fuscata]|nr:hypothetical protein BDF19DRAFT_412253 [Syncephalis fuscata]